MSHDSRYEAKCPQHGWYFFEDGCAVAGCENAPAVDQSGAFPETLREAALWEALKTYGQHRVGCPHPSCPDCRTHTMAASKTPGYSYCTRCGRGSIPTSDEACDCGFEAALERPRPAPPEPLAHEMFNAELRYKGLEIDVGAKLCALAGFRYDEPYGVDVTFDDYDTSFEFKNTPSTWEPTAEHRAAWWAMGFARAWVCYSDGTETYYAADGTVGNRHAGHAGGSAGTGAAPPDAELERLGAVAVEYYRTRRVVRDELAAVHRSGKLSYSYEMPSWKRECDAERELEIAARTFLERGGAAQPPPSAPSLGLGNALAEAVKEFLLALAAQEEADDWADNLDGSADEDADNEAERDAVVATRRVQAAERRLKVARENWVSGVPREETNPHE